MQDPTTGYVLLLLILQNTLLTWDRIRREREVDNCQADEDYTPKWLFAGRTGHVPTHHLQERYRLRKGTDSSNATIRGRA